MQPLVWIIDEEWADYDLEQKMLEEMYPGCTIKFSSYSYAEDLRSFGKDADTIICQIYAYIPAEVINQLNRCKSIAVYGGGYDRVDIAAAKAKGIKVTNVSNYCKEDLADYTMAAMYHFNKSLCDLASKVKQLPWGAQSVTVIPNRLSHSTLHIIGFNRIGQAVARKALGNDLTVTAYDPYIEAETMEKLGVKKVNWQEGLINADYISLNCILNEETTGLVQYEDFTRMKPTACLINTARGKIIDEPGMIRALHEGLIRGVMLDVVASEPPDYSEEIFSAPNALITPHISYISQQSFDELKRRAVNNAVMGMRGEISPDLVNP